MPGCVRALARELTGAGIARPEADAADGGAAADSEARSEADSDEASETSQSPMARAGLAPTYPSAEQLADRLAERWVETARRWWGVWGASGG